MSSTSTCKNGSIGIMVEIKSYYIQSLIQIINERCKSYPDVTTCTCLF